MQMCYFFLESCGNMVSVKHQAEFLFPVTMLFPLNYSNELNFGLQVTFVMFAVFF